MKYRSLLFVGVMGLWSGVYFQSKKTESLDKPLSTLKLNALPIGYSTDPNTIQKPIPQNSPLVEKKESPYSLKLLWDNFPRETQEQRLLFYKFIKDQIQEKHWLVYSIHQKLLTLDVSDKGFMLLAQALAEEGGSDGQLALIDILKQRFEERSLQTQVIPILGLVENPSIETQDYLEDLAFNQTQKGSISAQLSLGVLVNRLGPNARTQEWVQTMLNHLKEANTLSQQAHWLGVLGNTGHPSLLKELEPWLQHDNSLLRSQAYLSLRWVKNNEMILTKGLHDPQARIRENSILAFTHNPEAVFYLKDHYPNEQDPKVRKTLLRKLGEMGKGKDTLDFAAQYDTDQRVREEAQQQLQSLSDGKSFSEGI